MTAASKSLVAATFAALMLALPASAQTMSTLLPTLTWPGGDVTPSTKGCAATTQTVCTLKQ
ncbi:MAG: hypothetical protein WBP18_18870 [Paracoccaceae bacterium]